MLDGYACGCFGFIGELIFFRERMMLALFFRDVCIGMEFFDTEISGIDTGFCLFSNGQPTLLKQLKIMKVAHTDSGADNTLIGIDHDLPFGAVAFFLSAVAASLLFFGRCTGHSVASITIYSKLMPSS